MLEYADVGHNQCGVVIRFLYVPIYQQVRIGRTVGWAGHPLHQTQGCEFVARYANHYSTTARGPSLTDLVFTTVPSLPGAVVLNGRTKPVLVEYGESRQILISQDDWFRGLIITLCLSLSWTP